MPVSTGREERTMSNPDHSAWDVIAPDGTVLANGDEHDFGGWDEAADWKRANAPDATVVGR